MSSSTPPNLPMLTTLPPETIGRCIEFLPISDLVILSRTSRALHALSAPALYSTVHLDLTLHGPAFPRAHEAHIRNLVLHADQYKLGTKSQLPTGAFITSVPMREQKQSAIANLERGVELLECFGASQRTLRSVQIDETVLDVQDVDLAVRLTNALSNLPRLAHLDLQVDLGQIVGNAWPPNSDTAPALAHLESIFLSGAH